MSYKLTTDKAKSGFPFTARQKRMQKSNRHTRKEERHKTRNI